MTDEMKTKLYQDFYQKVLGYINGKVNNYTLAEDLCSDVFLKVYEKLDTFDESKASLSTWIFTITRNRLTDYFRTRHITGEIPETLAEDNSFEDDVCNGEMLETLADALEKLDTRERDIIIFHYYSGMTLKDVAEKMGISYSYVKLLHNNALAALKNFF